MRVFISWSGERSKSIAEALRTWLPRVLQSVSPWMSKEDLNAGSRWLNEVSFELNSCNVGILCEAMQAREQKMDKIFGMMDQSVDMMQGIQEISKRSEKDAQRMLMEMGEAFKTIDPQSPEGAQRMLRALGSSVTSKRKSALDMDINAFRTMRKELSQVDEEQKEFTRQIMNKPPAEDANCR